MLVGSAERFGQHLFLYVAKRDRSDTGYIRERFFIYLIKRKRYLIVADKVKWIIAFCLLAFVLYGIQKMESVLTQGEVQSQKTEVVIDAGHGGKDPGKVGVNDALEKDINLKIAKKLKTELESRGISVVMTRKEDRGLYDENADNKQVQDLKHRVELINEARPLLAVSIHQNSYPSPDVSGAQIFYYKHSKEGEKMASVIQKQLENLKGMKNRPIKENETYYLLKRTEVPTIIVECGFLSNPIEAQKLTEGNYQESVVQAVADGIEECLR